MSCYCEGEVADVWNETQRKARKQHICYECDDSIEIGETYTEVTYLFDGRWSRYRVCECCWADWENLKKLGHCVLLGGLSESIEEAYYEAPKVVA